ncbi:MAG: DUF2167 domain-containing protein [Paracoccaceae bacterium]|nr:DUF2167 domain-containing protein [Paracoccaceae bacterium]
MLLRSIAVAALTVMLTVQAQAKPFSEMFPQYADLEPGEARTFLESLDYRQGQIDLPGGFARLDVPEGYYYLGAQDAERVLSEAWGNPPSEPAPLGMILPETDTPFHGDGWAVEITWSEIGYVSDEDADEIDYDGLLAEMQSDAAAENAWRDENGYERIELIGWASPPRYDPVGRRLHWAKELKFGDSEVNTLNYNLRVLGRKGVLVMNFIANIDALPAVEAALPDVLALASFKEGSRYADFDPSVDEVAAVGIGGLIAGKALAKTGLLATLLIFLKKGWILILIALGAVWKFFTGRRA